MKSIIPIAFSFMLALVPLAHGADNAYDIIVMEASVGKAKPATLAIESSNTPGEIAFGKMTDGSFIGQRLSFKPLEIHTRKVEVVVEDLESPVTDKESGTSTQYVHKKVITLEADGKTRTVEINGKQLTYKVYAIGGVGDTNKILVEPQR